MPLTAKRPPAKLSHPSVVAIHDFGMVEERFWLAMEFVEGQTLGAWCQQAGRTWQEIVDVMERAGRGLEAAHAADLIHRDFKPDNVMVAVDGRVRLAPPRAERAARAPRGRG